jgi:hypothetical protein
MNQNNPDCQWVKDAFSEFSQHLQRVLDLLDITRKAISLLPGLPALVESLAKLHKNESAAKLTRAQEEAALARHEIETDFPFLHSQAAVLLWSALEELTESVVAKAITKEPSFLRREPWSSLRIRVGDYESIDGQERAYFLVDLLRNSVGASFRKGVGRFESLLAAIGCGGSVPNDTSDTLFELQQVRNLIVHNRGIVDQPLAKSCPWLNLTPGEELTITSGKYIRYATEVVNYAGHIKQRILSSEVA